MHATGTFEVTIETQGTDEITAGITLGRKSIVKQFTGDLAATSKGEMLSAMTSTRGSAGYVAIELVSGMLSGRPGSFVLQHHATMAKGVPQMSVQVVPNSGTGELAGLTGTMTIQIAEGKHSYDFEYAVAAGQ